MVQQKFKLEELEAQVKTMDTERSEFKTIVYRRNDEIFKLKEQMKQIIDENQNLKQEKVRIIGVNQILEQKIQVERSEMMSL